MNKFVITSAVIFMVFSAMMSIVIASADDSNASCGLEKRDVIKGIIAYLKNDADIPIQKQHVLTLIKAYLGSVDCSSQDVDDAKDVIDDVPDDVVPTCADGTPYTSCSYNKPLYCYMGQLISRCDLCCDSGLCGSDGACVEVDDSVSVSSPCAPRGDMDSDGGLDRADVELLYDVVDDDVISDSDLFKGDLNANGMLDFDDVVMLNNFILGKINTFAACGEVSNYIDCTAVFGDGYWCSNYDGWKLECDGSGAHVYLNGSSCQDAYGITGTHCVTCDSSVDDVDDPSLACHVTAAPSWFSYGIYDVKVVGLGCYSDSSYGMEYQIELGCDSDYPGETIWVTLEPGLPALDLGSFYNLYLVQGNSGVSISQVYGITEFEFNTCGGNESVYIDCGAVYGDSYWCSDYNEWKLECMGLGGYIELTGGACFRDDGAYGTHCVTCANTSSYNSWVFQLHEGVNMISFPMIPANNSVRAVFLPVLDNVETVWAYDASAVDPWKGYSPSAPFGNDLEFIVPYAGYEVLMAADDTLTVSGVPAVLSSDDLLSSLKTGYNLVGSGIYGVSIYGIKGEWKFDEDTASEYHMTLEPGKGYWIQCNTTDVFADLIDNDCDGIVDEANP